MKLIQKDRTKTLIPCYRDMDAYELPEEFAHLQAQDMSKIGFINDVVRGIKKVVAPESKEIPVVQTQVIENANSNVQALLDRGFMALEDGEWQKADDFFEQALNFDAKLAKAYLGKLMAEKHIRHPEKLRNLRQPYDDSPNYQKVLRFADENLKNKLTEDIAYMVNRNKMAEFESLYKEAVAAMSDSTDADAFWDASDMFEEIKDYKDSAELAKQCREKAETTRKDLILQNANSLLDDSHTWQGKDTDIDSYTKMIEKLETIKGYKDSTEKIQACQNKIEEIKKKLKEKRIAEENARIEQERKAEEKRILAEQRKENNRKLIKKIGVIVSPILCIIIAFIIVLNTVIIPNHKYDEALSALENRDYEQAVSLFEEIGYRKDSKEIIYNEAKRLTSEDNIDSIKLFSKIWNYKDTKTEITKCIRNKKFLTTSPGNTFGLKLNGTVVATGHYFYSNDISKWTDIVNVSNGDSQHTVGLKENGTIVAERYTDEVQHALSNWSDIIDISVGDAVRVFGLKSDGTVVVKGSSGFGACDVFDWTDIVAISAGSLCTVGLKSNGMVVATGNNDDGQCNVSNWTDIVAISAGGDHTVGLKSDGTVVAVGNNDDGQCNVSSWSNIVEISAAYGHTVGLKIDGTDVAVGSNSSNQCDTQEWNLFE